MCVALSQLEQHLSLFPPVIYPTRLQTGKIRKRGFKTLREEWGGAPCVDGSQQNQSHDAIRAPFDITATDCLFKSRRALKKKKKRKDKNTDSG